MALSSFLSALLLKRQKRKQAQINFRAVDHLTDEQLKDIGLWRMNNQVGQYTDNVMPAKKQHKE